MANKETRIAKKSAKKRQKTRRFQKRKKHLKNNIIKKQQNPIKVAPPQTNSLWERLKKLSRNTRK